MYQSLVIPLDSYRNHNSSLAQTKVKRHAIITREGKDRTVNKWTHLICLYTRQKRFAEYKTQHSIECCHNQISQEIQAFFSKKKYFLTLHLMESNSPIFDRNEIEILTQNIQRIIDKELCLRFKTIPTTSITSMDLYSDEELSSLLRLIQEWRSNKKRTVLITQQIEKWSQSVWNNGMHRVVPLQPLATSFELINLPQKLLQSLDIDSRNQLQSLHSQTCERVEGIMISLEYRFVSMLKRYCSQLFYSLHDELIDKKLNQKILDFSINILNFQTYHMEA